MSAPVPISDSGSVGATIAAPGGGSVIWPRRTTKACASCRRDKIRCDGGRPCGACAKKGYAANQCTDGCDPCRRARVRCEDGTTKPCRRCLELKIECLDGPPISMYHGGEVASGRNGHSGDEDAKDVSDQPENSADGQLVVDTGSGRVPRAANSKSQPPNSPTRSTGSKTPRTGERAKLACASCRRDNKKCDDSRPCSRCIARSEQCVHVGRGPKLVKLRCEGCREDNKRCEETRPCKYCVSNKKECIVVPRKGRGHGTRVKAACMSCRRDKIRCTGERPCSACIKKGCDCVDRQCNTCTKDGAPTDCGHRRTVSAETPAPQTQASPSLPPKREPPPPPKAANHREKDFRFVPSHDDSRWLTYASASQTQSSSTQAQPSGQPSGQATSPGFVAGSFYYPSYSNGHTPFPTYAMGTPGGYPQAPNPATYFFDVLDPGLGNFHLSQHMSSTSASRTFMPDD